MDSYKKLNKKLESSLFRKIILLLIVVLISRPGFFLPGEECDDDIIDGCDNNVNLADLDNNGIADACE